MEIIPINRSRLDLLSERGTVVEEDYYGLKVLRLPDGRFLKFFRRKRLLNKDLLAPAAIRFARHARHLQQLQIPTLTVERLHSIRGEPHSVAIYQPLPGETLRQMLLEHRVGPEQMYRVGVFIARLHRLGVYFRSLHPGNIVLDGQIPGLIDVLDCRIWPWSLTRWQRRRNWRHFLRCQEDHPQMTGELVDELLCGYRDAADLPVSEGRREVAHVREILR